MQTTENQTLEEFALEYAAQGIPVFPVWGINERGECDCANAEACENGENAGKHPITPRGVLDASTNEAKIRVWWSVHPNANIGIATGERSGIVVLDVDGKQGFLSMQQFMVPYAPQVATGRDDGGIHHWFAWPGHRTKNSASKIAPGLDVRGDGGYVIAPPSRHRSGNLYQWIAPLTDTLPTMPDWLLKATVADSPGFTIENDNVEPIEKGGRNVYLTSLAGTYRRRGASYAETVAALKIRNVERCDPPLPESEVERIAESITQKPFSKRDEPQISVTIFDDMLGDVTSNDVCINAGYNDVGNGEAFVSLYGDRFRFDHNRKKWMVWFPDTGVWREDQNKHAWRGMLATIRLRQSAAPQISDVAKRQEMMVAMNKSQNGSGVKNALEHASSLASVSMITTDFDAHPALLNCLNGTLDLTTMQFDIARQTDYLTRQTNVEYDPSARCPRWESFIDQIFAGNEELIAYVQRALGYSIGGHTNEQAFFIAHGTGANGKSTLLNTIRKVLGDYGSVTPFTTFDADNRNQYGNDLAALKSRRYVLAIEAEHSKRLAEARVKTITGGDTITCRYLYGEFFEFTPEFKVWLAVNHKPVIRGGDHGIWRRIHLIPFNVTFAGDAIDRNLDMKLAEEMAGIFNWLVEGFQRWRADGLNMPASIMVATEDYKRENDYVAAWIESECDEGTAEFMSVTFGYNNFREYLKTTGEIERVIPSQRAWSNSMTERGYQKVRNKNGRFEFAGVGLKPAVLSVREE